MTKISDEVIRTPDPILREVISNLITLWNLGKISFNEVSVVPNDTPDDVEIRAFRSGTTYKLYIYLPSISAWKSVTLS